MGRRIGGISLVFIFILSISVSSNAQKVSLNNLEGSKLNTITTAVPFLMIATDARSGALGDAGAAISPDANSIHWNPAKLAFVEKELGFSVSYTPWLRALVNDINLSYLSGYKRIDNKQTIGFSLLYFSLGQIDFTNDVGDNIGEYNPNEFATDAAYARKLSDKLSLGVSLRFIYSNLTGQAIVGGAETKPGTSVAADISTYYNTDFDVSGKKTKFAFGANISNIGSKMTYTQSAERDFIPINLRLGTSWRINLDDYNTLAFIADVNKLLVPTPDFDSLTGQSLTADKTLLNGMFGSFSDAPGGFNEEMREFAYSLGIEYWYDDQFALRAGYFHEHQTKGNRKYFTLGAGLKYNVFGVDFAYLITTETRHPLENTLRFSLHFDFNAFKGNTKPVKVVEEKKEG
ncbi:type IX secretion system outer membrane channel protein PorV [bacterium AH-315-C07]|nr:type IX secretion system outer membrane channel protein PorV [bacterium AH-315-C07]